MQYLFCVVPCLFAAFAWLCALELFGRGVLRVLRAMLPVVLMSCVSLSAATDRTRVERIPVGTTGAITSINVKAYFYTYDSGSATAKYLMEWVETTAGVLSGSRTVKAASIGGSYGSPVTITSTYTASWVPQFSSSWNVEAVTGWKYVDVNPLAGAAWFAAPNDTLTYVQDTWQNVAEGGGADDPGFTPSAATDYFKLIPEVIGSFTTYADVSPVWGTGANTATVPDHCRSVKAFARTSTSNDLLYTSLVWDEVISNDACYRYWFRYKRSNAAGNRQQTTQILNASGTVLGVIFCQKYAISYAGGTQSGATQTTSPNNSIVARTVVGGVSSADVHCTDAKLMVARFVAAYDRDHGSGGAAAVAAAFDSTSALTFWPERPEGAATFNYESEVLTLGPLFDVCTGSTSTGGGSSGSYTGPSSDAFPSSTLPSGAGTAEAGAVPTVSGMAATLGGMVGNYSAFTGLDSSAKTVTFTLTLPGASDPTSYTLSSLPDTETGMGAALDAFRVLLRGFLVVLLVYKFGKRVYLDLVTY